MLRLWCVWLGGGRVSCNRLWCNAVICKEGQWRRGWQGMKRLLPKAGIDSISLRVPRDSSPRLPEGRTHQRIGVSIWAWRVVKLYKLGLPGYPHQKIRQSGGKGSSSLDTDKAKCILLACWKPDELRKKWNFTSQISVLRSSTSVVWQYSVMWGICCVFTVTQHGILVVPVVSIQYIIMKAAAQCQTAVKHIHHVCVIEDVYQLFIRTFLPSNEKER